MHTKPNILAHRATAPRITRQQDRMSGRPVAAAKSHELPYLAHLAATHAQNQSQKIRYYDYNSDDICGREPLCDDDCCEDCDACYSLCLQCVSHLPCANTAAEKTVTFCNNAGTYCEQKICNPCCDCCKNACDKSLTGIDSAMKKCMEKCFAGDSDEKGLCKCSACCCLTSCLLGLASYQIGSPGLGCLSALFGASATLSGAMAADITEAHEYCSNCQAPIPAAMTKKSD